MQHHGIITLTTDFGLKDPFVGIMKGVILSIFPEANIIDVTHNIDTFSIEKTAYLLEYAYANFPSRTVHIVVVDPGVGGPRRPIVVSADDHFFMAPDNGVLTRILNKTMSPLIFELQQTHYFFKSGKGTTFQGRDIFAAAAAWLSKTLEPANFGEEVNDPVLLDLPEAQEQGNRISGEIIYIDHFGNLISNITQDYVMEFLKRKGAENATVTIGDHRIKGISTAYEESDGRRPVAVFDGLGALEIAVKENSAEKVLGLSRKEKIIVEASGGNIQ